MSAADILAILQGAVTTASLSCVGILLGLPLGLLLAITRWARVPVVAQVVTVYVSMLRATPLVTLVLLIFFALPERGRADRRRLGRHPGAGDEHLGLQLRDLARRR